MSYDIRFCVQTVQPNKDGECFAVVHTPEYDSPTYNYSKNARLAALACVLVHNTVARPFTPQRMAKRAQRLMKVEQPGNEWRPVYAFASLKKNLPGELLLPVQPISFEGETFMGPADPAGYLTALYGSTYMELPPENKRHTHMPDILDFGDGINVMDTLR